jgi:hypothetical protein
MMNWLWVLLIPSIAWMAYQTWMLRVRVNAMQSMPNWLPFDATPLTHPHFIQTGLLTDQLAELGFVHLADLAWINGEVETVQNESEARVLSGFGHSQSISSKERHQYTVILRITAHPNLGCYGCVLTDVRTTAYSSDLTLDKVNRAGRLDVLVLSLGEFGDGQIGFGTTSQPIDGLSWLARQPQSLGHSIPNASPLQLWNAHLQDRESLVGSAGIEWDLQPTLQKYLESDSLRRTQRADYFRRTSFSSIISQLLLSRITESLGTSTERRWLGEFQAR